MVGRDLDLPCWEDWINTFGRQLQRPRTHAQNIHREGRRALQIIGIGILKVNYGIPCKNGTPITSNQDLHDGRVMPPQHAAIIMYSNRTIKPVNRNLQWPENKIVISPCEIINSWEKLQRRWQILVSRIRIKSSGLDFVYERGHDPVIQMIDVLGLEARNIKSLYFWTIGPAMIMPQKTMHNSTPNSWGSHLVFTFNSEK